MKGTPAYLDPLEVAEGLPAAHHVRRVEEVDQNHIVELETLGLDDAHHDRVEILALVDWLALHDLADKVGWVRLISIRWKNTPKIYHKKKS